MLKTVKGFHGTWHKVGPSLDSTEVSHIKEPVSPKVSRMRQWQGSWALAGQLHASEISLTHNSEKGVKCKLYELQRYSQSPLGMSINLQIYLKLSKFTMTNVTAPLNWSSSLGSLGGLEECQQQGLGRKQISRFPENIGTYCRRHMENPILHGRRKFTNVSIVAEMSEGFQQSTPKCEKKGKLQVPGCHGKQIIFNLCCFWEKWVKGES